MYLLALKFINTQQGNYESSFSKPLDDFIVKCQLSHWKQKTSPRKTFGADFSPLKHVK